MQLFDPSKPLGQVTEAARRRIASAVESALEPEVLGADAQAWATELAGSECLAAPPAVDPAAVIVEEVGEVEVDCTGMPGVGFTLTETSVIRPGVRLRVILPADGSVELLAHNPGLGPKPDLSAEIEGQQIVATIDWPLVKGDAELESTIRQFASQVSSTAEQIAGIVEKFNDELKPYAVDLVEKRQQRIRDRTGFVAGLSLPVRQRDDAPRASPPRP